MKTPLQPPRAKPYPLCVSPRNFACEGSRASRADTTRLSRASLLRAFLSPVSSSSLRPTRTLYALDRYLGGVAGKRTRSGATRSYLAHHAQRIERRICYRLTSAVYASSILPLCLFSIVPRALSASSRISLYRRSCYSPARCCESADADKQRPFDVPRASEISEDGWSVAYKLSTPMAAPKLIGDLPSLTAASPRHQEGSICGSNSESLAADVGQAFVLAVAQNSQLTYALLLLASQDVQLDEIQRLRHCEGMVRRKRSARTGGYLEAGRGRLNSWSCRRASVYIAYPVCTAR